MKDKHKEEIKLLIINGSAILGAYLIKRLAEKTYELSTNSTPPKKPEVEAQTKWMEAIGWAAATGALASVLKLFIERGAKHQLDKLF